MKSPTTRNTETNTRPQLVHLNDMDHYKVADGDPDIRGWNVKTADGRSAGKVEGLVVDADALRVEFLDVELDRKGLNLKDDRHVLVPIATARLDDDHDDVLLGKTTATDLAGFQAYHPGQPIVPAPTVPRAQDRDVKNFYGKRGSGAVRKMTLSEEEMRVGKRTRDAGSVDVEKTVETRHVSKTVPVTHEEVTIERRPATGNTRAGKISEDEIRIPLSAEEAVVEKRTVPKEEVIIRKQTVQGEQKVQADLKQEHVEMDKNVKGAKKR